MKPRPIRSPVPGEHLLAVHPADPEDLATAWTRRLHHFPGRSLSADALSLEQTGRAGRLALRGQTLSAGVVTGLTAVLERSEEPIRGPGDGPDAPPVVRHFLRIGRGHGVTVDGEDVAVPRDRRINLAEVDVYAPASLASSTESASARRLLSPLGELLRRRVPLPPAGILVLQPVTVESVGSPVEDDDSGRGSAGTCDLDPESYAYEDWQLVDGCRLVLYAWPTDSLPLPARDQRWRNRLAHAVFTAEAGRGPEAPLPWEELGVPIGLVAFDTTPPDRRIRWDLGEMSWTPLFVDRGSVARAGGRPRRRSSPAAGVINPFLRQARVEQFAEHLASLGAEVTPERLAAEFRFLPPVGLLHRSAMDLVERRDRFFPPTFAVEAAPIPLEQLEVILEESAGLTPYDLFGRDEVRVYVPVPQIWFEPRLLLTEVESPEFAAAIESFSLRRGRWLRRRRDVREKSSLLGEAISGEPTVYPDPDPEALEPEDEAEDPIDPEDPLLAEPEGAFGTITDPDGAPAAEAVVKLKEDLVARTPIRHEARAALAALPGGFPGFPAVAGRIRFDDASDELIFTGRMTDAERDALLGASSDVPYTQAVQLLYARSQRDELSRLDEVGVRGFIDLLEERAAAAEDRIDLGFARVQTDIYRVRQLMMGTEGASRLATSPALAEIAKGVSARATQEALSEFVSRVKRAPVSAQAAAAEAEPETSASTSPVFLDTSALNFATLSMTAIRPENGERFAVASEPTRGTAPAPSGTTSPTFFTTALAADQPLFATTSFVAPKLTLEQASIQEAQVRQTLASQAVISAANIPLFRAPVDIRQQSPIVGKALNFRTASVAERLATPPAAEAKNFSVATKYAVLSDLSGIEINLDDLEVPGFYAYVGGVRQQDDVPDPRDPSKVRRVPRERKHTFQEIRESALLTQVLHEWHDPDPSDADEAGFFSAAVRALDHTVAALRLVEGRVQAYRAAISLCRSALAALEGEVANAETRLRAIAEELAEARHDVAIARSLLEDERARVASINERRAKILAEHVDFLAYQRPRQSDLIFDLPARGLDPAVAQPPVPPCLAKRTPVPAELDPVVELLRETPVEWFTHVQALLDRLDRMEALRRAMERAKQRATLALAPRVALPVFADGTRLGKAISGLVLAQRQTLSTFRVQTAQLDLGLLSAASWASARDVARRVVSLGDLIDASHGRAEVAEKAARELEDLARVAGCLYEEFGEVLPALRLQWAERLSQFDAPANLRNLASLPRWGEIPFLDRRTMQGMVDWLFGRFDARHAGSLKLANDMVRLCLLLASHAPVNRIVAGHVHRDTPVRRDARVELKVDLAQVRVGMRVNFFSGTQVVARGVVEDLSTGLAAARVVEELRTDAQLAAGARVQFLEPERVGGFIAAGLRAPLA